MRPRVLIAGIGNIFHGDDVFGVIVARTLLNEGSVPGALVRDFGIRGIDLVFAFLDGYEMVVLVDAVSRGGEPGTIYVIEPDLRQLAEPEAGIAVMDGHRLDPWQVLQQAARMGTEFGRVVLVGCEPACVDESEGLSGAVQAAVEPAVRTIRTLVGDYLSREDPLQAEELVG